MLAVGILAAASGAVHIPLADLARLIGGDSTPRDALWRNVLFDIRLPRVLFAATAGAALAICGAAMQALFRNPLAEPGLVGISAGGAMGAVLAIVL
ncbi:iron chelate uptake ABC transporter family permease subunit, partial [Bordetella pertussis]